MTKEHDEVVPHQAEHVVVELIDYPLSTTWPLDLTAA